MSATNENVSIYSRLGGDPVLAELVEVYVTEMPDRMEALNQAFHSGDFEELGRLAHQLKGAAGTHGYDQITPLAADVAFSVRENEPVEKIQKALQGIIGACQQLRAGTPDAPAVERRLEGNRVTRESII